MEGERKVKRSRKEGPYNDRIRVKIFLCLRKIGIAFRSRIRGSIVFFFLCLGGEFENDVGILQGYLVFFLEELSGDLAINYVRLVSSFGLMWSRECWP